MILKRNMYDIIEIDKLGRLFYNGRLVEMDKDEKVKFIKRVLPKYLFNYQNKEIKVAQILYERALEEHISKTTAETYIALKQAKEKLEQTQEKIKKIRRNSNLKKIEDFNKLKKLLLGA